MHYSQDAQILTNFHFTNGKSIAALRHTGDRNQEQKHQGSDTRLIQETYTI